MADECLADAKGAGVGTTGWHERLLEQLARHFGPAGPPRALAPLLAEIDRSYRDADEERARLKAAYTEARDALQRGVEERTVALEQANEELRRQMADREQVEAQLRQSQRMEAIGQLAGGVAHDFNNLLTAIVGYTELLLAKPSDDPARRHVTEIRRAADRAASLTRQLLAFSRRQLMTPEVLDVNQLAVELSRMLRRLIGEHIVFNLQLDATIGAVRADRTQLEQVLMNLAVNARDAMPTGGHLTIGTSEVDLDEFTAARRGVAPGRYVVATVRDTGIGMSPQTQARIFEPFFTTKEPGQGTGLGLATVYGIVRQSGGAIAVDSTLGHGATFAILLPRVAHAAAVAEPAEPRPAIGGTETVLVVEDEPALRDLIARVLSENGYTVLLAENGLGALHAVRAEGAKVAAVLSDVVMPLMSGPQLAEQVREERPDVPVLFMTGYTDDSAVVCDLERGVRVLHKPFTPSDLLVALREVLDARPQSAAA